MKPPRKTGRRRSTTSQLRDDIDSGRTGDKVRAKDPAAVPLGTDAEAGGSPPDPEAVDLARDGEPAAARDDTAPQEGSAAGARWRGVPLRLIVLAALAAALLVLAALAL